MEALNRLSQCNGITFGRKDSPARKMTSSAAFIASTYQGSREFSALQISALSGMLLIATRTEMFD